MLHLSQYDLLSLSRDSDDAKISLGFTDGKNWAYNDVASAAGGIESKREKGHCKPRTGTEEEE